MSSTIGDYCLSVVISLLNEISSQASFGFTDLQETVSQTLSSVLNQRDLCLKTRIISGGTVTTDTKQSSSMTSDLLNRRLEALQGSSDFLTLPPLQLKRKAEQSSLQREESGLPVPSTRLKPSVASVLKKEKIFGKSSAELTTSSNLTTESQTPSGASQVSKLARLTTLKSPKVLKDPLSVVPGAESKPSTYPEMEATLSSWQDDWDTMMGRHRPVVLSKGDLDYTQEDEMESDYDE